MFTNTLCVWPAPHRYLPLYSHVCSYCRFRLVMNIRWVIRQAVFGDTNTVANTVNLLTLRLFVAENTNTSPTLNAANTTLTYINKHIYRHVSHTQKTHIDHTRNMLSVYTYESLTSHSIGAIWCIVVRGGGLTIYQQTVMLIIIMLLPKTTFIRIIAHIAQLNSVCLCLGMAKTQNVPYNLPHVGLFWFFLRLYLSVYSIFAM